MARDKRDVHQAVDPKQVAKPARRARRRAIGAVALSVAIGRLVMRRNRIRQQIERLKAQIRAIGREIANDE